MFRDKYSLVKKNCDKKNENNGGGANKFCRGKTKKIFEVKKLQDAL